MTTPNELDRALAEWLHDGPSRSPDRPVQVAVDYARAHSRRPEPLRFLRRDPMASRQLALGARPVLVLAIVGLLAVALAIAAIGSNRGPAVIPAISPPPPSATAPASPSPTMAPLLQVVLPAETGDATVTIRDFSGLLRTGRVPSPDEPNPDPNASLPDAGVLVQNQDPRTLRLTWADGPCDTAFTLTIDDQAQTMTVTGARCEGDALGVQRELLLEFDAPVDASDVAASLELR